MTDAKTVVFVCSHHSGHIHPLLTLVDLFGRHGYRVYFVTSHSRRSMVESAGATFLADDLEGNDLDTVTLQTIQDRLHLQPTEAVKGSVFFEQILPATVGYFRPENDLIGRIQQVQPSFMVCDVSALWGVVIAKYVLSVPLITSCSCSLMDTKTIEGACGYLTGIDFLIKSKQWLLDNVPIHQSLENNKEGLDSYDIRFSYLNESKFMICWSFKDFQECDTSKREAPHVHYFGAAMPRNITERLAQQTQDMNKPENDSSLADFVNQARAQKKRLVFISLGTVVGQEKWTLQGAKEDMVASFYRRLFTVLGEIDGDSAHESAKDNLGGKDFACILSIGKTRSVSDFDDPTTGCSTIPSNFYVASFVPQIWVLSQVDAFVTHCGNNGVHEAMFFGVPMLCIPCFGDQHGNAKIIADRHIGVQIPSPFAPAPSSNLDHVTTGLLCQKMKELLVERNEEIVSSCKKVQSNLGELYRYLHGDGDSGGAFADMQKFVNEEASHLTPSS